MEKQLSFFETVKNLFWLPEFPFKSKDKISFAHSKLADLFLVRRKIASWKNHGYLEKHCFFTTRFLKRTGQMEAVSHHYFRSAKPSPVIEEVRPQFSAWLEQNTEGLTSIIARFEAGMTAVHKGQDYNDEFIWPCDPIPVIHALVTESLSEESIQPGKYRMRLSDKILSTFEVEKID